MVVPPLHNFCMLRACVKSVFARLPEEYAMSYLDEDGDRITLGS